MRQLAEVGKLTIEHLRPKHKPSIRHVADIVYTQKSVGSKGYTFFGLLETSKDRGIGLNFFSLKVKKSIPRNGVRHRSKLIEVEVSIFAFGFSKKFNISLIRSNVGYSIGVGHSTGLPVSTPTSGNKGLMEYK
jgi:hypothetical protein